MLNRLRVYLDGMYEGVLIKYILASQIGANWCLFFRLLRKSPDVVVFQELM